MNICQPHVWCCIFAHQLLMIGHIEDRNVELAPGLTKFVFVAGPPDPVSANQHRVPGLCDQSQDRFQVARIGPGARGRAVGALERPLVAPGILVEGRKHDVDGNAEVDRARISAGRDLPCPVDELSDPLSIGDAFGILGQRCRDLDIVDFLEAAGALTFQRARTGDEDDGRALTPGLHDCRQCVGKAFRTDQADCGFAGDARMAISEVARNLFMRAVDDRHLAFHEAFECRIAEAAGQRKDVLHAFFMQGACEQIASTNASLLTHDRVPTAFVSCGTAQRKRVGPLVEMARTAELYRNFKQVPAHDDVAGIDFVHVVDHALDHTRFVE